MCVDVDPLPTQEFSYAVDNVLWVGKLWPRECARVATRVRERSGRYLVEGVCEKKGVLRKKKKKKISRLNPLYLATI